jgi:hypothetical protein
MIPSMLQGGVSTGTDGGIAPPPAPGPAPKRDGRSFSDISATMPDPALVARQQRLRRIVLSIMGGALALLVLAGVCAIVRKAPSEREVAPTAIAPAPVVTNAVPAAEPAPLPSVTEPAAEPEATAARSEAKPAPVAKPRHPKAAPHKTRNASTR